MQEYKFKNNGTKIEAFQQQVADATYTLPMHVYNASTGIANLINKTVEVKKEQWIVKYIPVSGNINYVIVNDKEFRERYEPVPATTTTPNTLKSASSQELMQEAMKRLEKELQQTPWQRDKPQKFYFDIESTQYPLYWCYTTTPLGGKTSLK